MVSKTRIFFKSCNNVTEQKWEDVTMKKKTKRFLAMILALAMAFCSINTIAFAAEAEDTDDVTVIELNLDDMVLLDDTETPMLESSDEISSRSSSIEKVDLLNKAGVTSSDLCLPFTVPSTCLGNVYIVVCFSYTDGTTGSIYVTCAQYSGTLDVNGKSITAVYGGNLLGGNYAFKTSGLTKQMAYVVKVYVAS
jgi:hypothetical protein